MRYVLKMRLTMSDGSDATLSRTVELPGHPRCGDLLSGYGFTDSVVMCGRWNYETDQGAVELAERSAQKPLDEYKALGWTVEPE